MKRRWEYLVSYYSWNEAALNVLGEQGWELVAIWRDENESLVTTFKREVCNE